MKLDTDGKKYTCARARYCLTKDGKKQLCQYLSDCTYPDGFCASMSKCVNLQTQKISGLKTHDCHILLQRTLPAGLRGLVGSDIYEAIADLGKIFKSLCSKTLERDVLLRLKDDIPVIMCRLENIFPPAFFDVMMHLAVHLP